MADVKFLSRDGKPRLVYSHRKTPASEAKNFDVVFLTGFRSDMRGEKAEYLYRCAERDDFSFLRFDYSGHGSSEGDFADLTLSDWLQDVLSVLDNLAGRRVILIGSSMGGWLGLRAALLRPGQIQSFIGISTAPDFTRTIRSHLTNAQKTELKETGVIQVPCDYGAAAAYPVSEKLIDDGENHILLDKPLSISVPVRLFQGGKDTDVPYPTALELYKKIESDDIRLELVKNADHRFSAPENLQSVERGLTELIGKLS